MHVLMHLLHSCSHRGTLRFQPFRRGFSAPIFPFVFNDVFIRCHRNIVVYDDAGDFIFAVGIISADVNFAVDVISGDVIFAIDVTLVFIADVIFARRRFTDCLAGGVFPSQTLQQPPLLRSMLRWLPERRRRYRRRCRRQRGLGTDEDRNRNGRSHPTLYSPGPRSA